MQILIPAVLALLSFHVAGQPPEQGPSLPKSVTKNSSDALTGLTGVHVEVQVDDEEKVSSLDEDAVTTRVELALRRNGIRVYTEKEMLLAVGMPSLSIKVMFAGSTGSVSIECEQNVKSIVSAGVTIIGAVTWENHFMGGSKRVQEGIDMAVDLFCNDFLKANPRKF